MLGGTEKGVAVIFLSRITGFLVGCRWVAEQVGLSSAAFHLMEFKLFFLLTYKPQKMENYIHKCDFVLRKVGGYFTKQSEKTDRQTDR